MFDIPKGTTHIYLKNSSVGRGIFKKFYKNHGSNIIYFHSALSQEWLVSTLFNKSRFDRDFRFIRIKHAHEAFMLVTLADNVDILGDHKWQ